jgi:hypothetical protein
MAPQFVKPYVKTNKHDAADAEAICEAVTRPNIGSCRSKPLSSKPYWHFTGVVRASSNSEPHKPIKSGLLAEFGNVVPQVSSSYSET